MFIDLFLAFTLITAGEQAKTPPCALASMQAVAASLEIFDPRECRYVFVRLEDFDQDLKLIRSRFQELADAPPLCDAVRLPGRETISELLAFNRRCRQHLEDRAAYYPSIRDAAAFRAAIAEADKLYSIWDNARDARCDYYYVTVRRQALKKLRKEIGAEAYYSARLPPCVPVWRFQRVE